MPGTQISMSFILDLEPTCEVTVEARMSTRPGCSASGGDSGDALRVRNISGSEPWVTGSNNATLFDSHTQTGGQVIIEGNANRADEIITYEVYYESGNCPFCLFLPVELLNFSAFAEGLSVYLDWSTASENNNHGFDIQLSRTGLDFSSIGFVNGAGTTQLTQQYSYAAELPSPGLWYLRLAQTDHDGTVAYSPVVVLRAEARDAFTIQTTPTGLSVQSLLSAPERAQVDIYGPSGQLIRSETPEFAPQETRQWTLPEGLYIVRVQLSSGEVITEKVIR